MYKHSISLAFLTILTISSCGKIGIKSQEVSNEVKIDDAVNARLIAVNTNDINNIANNLQVKHRVVTNIPSDKCQQDIADGNCFEVELTLTAKQAISVNGWQIHFSQIAPIQSFESTEFSVMHINGDLHQVSLTENFKGFAENETKRILYRAMFWSLSETDAIPNYIVSAVNSNPAWKIIKPEVIKSTMAGFDSETSLETLPFVVPFNDIDKQFKRSKNDKTQWLNSIELYQRNLKLGDKLADVSDKIIPTPKQMIVDSHFQTLDLGQGINISYNKLVPSTVEAALNRLARLGVKQTSSGISTTLSVVADSAKLIGSYRLNVSKQSIEVIGVDSAGVFNGLQSLASLMMPNNLNVAQVRIDDEPHYQFRGLLVDVARNFHSKAFILRLLEQMAAYKLNKLHLHLGDDEGWRLEIPSLPELTQVSAKRCFDLKEQTCLQPQLGAGVEQESSVNGYYSVAVYQEILQAASARHIQVIPSLDMPGHSRAAIKAMTVRTQKYAIAENEEEAQQFNLYDPFDTTRYSSVQFYNDNTINVCLESSYAFVHEVMTQVKQIHAEAGQPLTRYHIGADETAGAWVDSPACKAFVANNTHGVKDMSELGAYFIERVASILSELDIETAGWSDGLSHTRKEKMPAIVQSNAWDVLFWGGHEKVHELTNRDWQVVISSPDVLYFDFPYEADPKEHGYYWASRHTNTEKVFQFMPDNLPVHAEIWLDREDNPYIADDRKNPLAKGKTFYGIQGQLWSENTRSDTMAEYKIFPRLYALAERAWHKADWAVPYNYQGAQYSQNTNEFDDERRIQRDKQWRIFANTIGQKSLAKLENSQVFYRLPNVGATIVNGELKANIAFPGLVIEYREKDGVWKSYQHPVKVSGNVSVRSRSFDGNRSSRESLIKYNNQ
jgi:hexosaminidase